MASLDDKQIIQQFVELPPEKQVILFHPMARNAHRHLKQYLLKNTNCFYFCFSSEINDVESFFDQIAAAFAAQFNIRYTVAKTTEEAIQQISDAFFESGCQYMYLDACQHKLNDAILPLIPPILAQFDKTQRIIINGTPIHLKLFQEMGLVDTTQVLPIDPSHLIVDFLHPSEDRAILEVRAFGQGKVLVNGRKIERWEGFLPRTLCYFFIDRAMTTRNEVFQVFWPNFSISDATNVFHVTKRKIHELLDIKLTVFGGGFYRVSNEIDLYYDVVHFQEAVQNAAIANDEEAMQLYQRAINIYNGDFLTDVDMPWAVKRRDEMRTTYIDALSGLARIQLDRKNTDIALGLFLRATSLAPSREDIVRHIMEIYMNKDEYQHALDAFVRLEQVLLDLYDVPPDPQTMALAHYIKDQLNLL